MTHVRCVFLAGLVTLGGLVAAPAARAAEVEPYLPDDTEMVVVVNLRQIFDSPLYKQYGADLVKQALKDNPDVEGVLKDLGVDLSKDVDKLTIASPGGNDATRGLMVLRGTFDPDKFKAKGEEAAKAHGDVLKVHKTAKGDLIYEVLLPDGTDSLFVSVLGKNVLVAAPAKDYVQDALKKDGKKATLKDERLRKLLGNVNEKQSVSVALVGRAVQNFGPGGQEVKDLLVKLDALGGGLTVTDEVKLEVVAAMKDADAAKAARKTLNDNLNLALAGLGALNAPELEPLLDFVKSTKVNAEGDTLVLKAAVDADTIKKAMKNFGRP